MSVMHNGGRRPWKSIHPTRQAGYVAEWDDMNSKIEKQGVHPFYEGIVENCYSNSVSDGRTKFYNVPTIKY